MKTCLMLVVIYLAVMLGAPAMAEETKKDESATIAHDYVGVKKCKLCHKKDNVHPSWLETKHAKAWDILNPEQQKDEKCVVCHSTGTTAKGVLLEGVQCEACHGPGNDYKKKKIMQDTKLAMENGLLIPDENTCKKCHNENVPEEFRAKEKFDFEKMKVKGVHETATKTPAKKG